MFGHFSSNALSDQEKSGGGSSVGLCELSSSKQKFAEDCFMYENDKYKIWCEGCVLNSAALKSGGSLGSRIAEIYEKDPKSIATTLKGAYIVAVLEKRDGSVFVTNDLFSKKQLFYHFGDAGFLFSDSFFELCGRLKKRGVALTVDNAAISMIFAYRYMFEDYTYAREIRYLNGFHSLSYRRGALELVELPKPETEISISPDEACAQADRLFIDACRLQFAKNESAGYKQICSLSGGMDSKAVFLSGIRAGYGIDRCFTYAESGSLDESIPIKIASDYGVVHLFRAIDGGSFLLDRENMIAGSEGHIYYAGTTGLYGAISSMRTDDVGIIHAGIGGGEIMGDVNAIIADGENDARFERFVKGLKLSGEESEKLFDRIKSEYINYNQFCNLSDFRQCINFARTIQGHCYAFSPFLDEDFFCFMASVPASMKLERALYRRWCTEYMSNPYVSTSKFVTSKEKSNAGVGVRRFCDKVSKRLSIMAGRKSKLDMNPFDYWFRNNPKLKPAFDNMLKSDLSSLGMLDAELIDRLKSFYDRDDVIAKTNVLTVTWALAKMYE